MLLDWDLIVDNTINIFGDMAKTLWPVLRPYIVAGFVGCVFIFFVKRSIHFFVYVSSASNYEARRREKRIFALVDLIDCLRGLSSKAK